MFSQKHLYGRSTTPRRVKLSDLPVCVCSQEVPHTCCTGEKLGKVELPIYKDTLSSPPGSVSPRLRRFLGPEFTLKPEEGLSGKQLSIAERMTEILSKRESQPSVDKEKELILENLLRDSSQESRFSHWQSPPLTPIADTGMDYETLHPYWTTAVEKHQQLYGYMEPQELEKPIGFTDWWNQENYGATAKKDGLMDIEDRKSPCLMTSSTILEQEEKEVSPTGCFSSSPIDIPCRLRSKAHSFGGDRRLSYLRQIDHSPVSIMESVISEQSQEGSFYSMSTPRMSQWSCSSNSYDNSSQEEIEHQSKKEKLD